MFDISLNFDNITICSIERKDISTVKEWLELQKYDGNSNEKYLNVDEFSERFLESFVCESEFLVKVTIENKLIGIIKGRVEFRHKNEVWIWCYVIDNGINNNELGSVIVDNLTSYFIKEFGIYNFYTVIAEDNNDVIKFWGDQGFKLLRVAENYFENNGEKADMLILKKGS